MYVKTGCLGVHVVHIYTQGVVMPVRNYGKHQTCSYVSKGGKHHKYTCMQLLNQWWGQTSYLSTHAFVESVIEVNTAMTRMQLVCDECLQLVYQREGT